MSRIILDPTAELKRIERAAQKILKEKTKKTSGRKRPMSETQKIQRRENMKYARRLAQYKHMTGRRRITREEKTALHFFTPKRVTKRVELESKTYKRRIKKYESDYGVTASSGAKYALQYAGPAMVARMMGVEKPTDNTEWAEFSEVNLPNTSWDKLPSSIRKWERSSQGYFLYDNFDLIIRNNRTLLEDVRLYGTDGYDHSLHDFFDIVVPHLFGDSVLFDPQVNGQRSGGLFFVKKEEWDDVVEVDSNYTENRKYKRPNSEAKSENNTDDDKKKKLAATVVKILSML